MMMIYLAGPFFNETEIRNVEYAERVLTARGFDLFSPMRHEERSEEPGTPAWARKLFEMDRAAIDEAADSNLMMHCGCRTNIGLGELETFDFETMPVYDYRGKML